MDVADDQHHDQPPPPAAVDAQGTQGAAPDEQQQQQEQPGGDAQAPPLEDVVMSSGDAVSMESNPTPPQSSDEHPPPTQPAQHTPEPIPPEVQAQLDDPALDTYLLDCVSHASRMLESVVSNPDQSRAFVAAGGIDLLLRLYSLPRLPPAFATSGGQYGLLGTFKTFTPQQAPHVSTAISNALVARLVVATQAAQDMGPVNICTLPEAQRTAYVKLLAGVDGLVGLAAAVVRTATPMLVEVGAPRQEANGGTLIGMLSTLLQWVAFQASAGDLYLQQQAVAGGEGGGAGGSRPVLASHEVCVCVCVYVMHLQDSLCITCVHAPT